MCGTEGLPALPSRELQRSFAAGIRRLEAAVGRARWGTDSIANADQVYGMAEYEDLLREAYADGFVHGELSHDGIDLETINARPEVQLAALPGRELRRYVHALYRCERHNHGWGSVVLMAVQSGALGLVARRLESGL